MGEDVFLAQREMAYISFAVRGVVVRCVVTVFPDLEEVFHYAWPILGVGASPRIVIDLAEREGFEPSPDQRLP